MTKTIFFNIFHIFHSDSEASTNPLTGFHEQFDKENEGIDNICIDSNTINSTNSKHSKYNKKVKFIEEAKYLVLCLFVVCSLLTNIGSDLLTGLALIQHCVHFVIPENCSINTQHARCAEYIYDSSEIINLIS